MTNSSVGVRREAQHELTTPSDPNGGVPCVDVVWMKPNMSAVLKARSKAWLSIPSD